jgi:hypothetical protein
VGAHEKLTELASGRKRFAVLGLVRSYNCVTAAPCQCQEAGLEFGRGSQRSHPCIARKIFFSLSLRGPTQSNETIP